MGAQALRGKEILVGAFQRQVQAASIAQVLAVCQAAGQTAVECSVHKQGFVVKPVFT